MHRKSIVMMNSLRNVPTCQPKLVHIHSQEKDSFMISYTLKRQVLTMLLSMTHNVNIWHLYVNVKNNERGTCISLKVIFPCE